MAASNSAFADIPQIELIGIPDDVLPPAGLFVNKSPANAAGKILLNQLADSIRESILSSHLKLMSLNTKH